MEKDKKGAPNCDPGWNDPPMFSYESQNALKSPKTRTILNKRVAFPLNKNLQAALSNPVPVDPTAPLPVCNVSNLPPPPSFPVQPTKAVVENKDKCTPDLDFNAEKTLEDIMKNFNSLLVEKFEKDEKDKVDIQRRLDTMGKMWKENILCKDVQQRLLELSEALLENEIEVADDLHKGLMVDHASDCSPWMSGVRRLIHEFQLTTTDDEK